MLVEEGENLLRRSGKDIMEEEGWLSPLSRQTQETRLDPRVRQPRAALGKTASGKILVIVISGRSRLSRGATFEETADRAMEITGDDTLKFLVNLDGGASASLTAVLKDHHEVLSYPAPSENNPVQMPRPVPALLFISPRQ